jgi:hypothetical protein
MSQLLYILNYFYLHSFLYSPSPRIDVVSICVCARSHAYKGALRVRCTKTAQTETTKKEEKKRKKETKPATGRHQIRRISKEKKRTQDRL